VGQWSLRHSRSLILVPIESLYVTSYNYLRCTVVQLITLHRWMDVLISAAHTVFYKLFWGGECLLAVTCLQLGKRPDHIYSTQTHKSTYNWRHCNQHNAILELSFCTVPLQKFLWQRHSKSHSFIHSFIHLFIYSTQLTCHNLKLVRWRNAASYWSEY